MISTCRSNWINSLSNDVMLKPQKPQKVEPFFKHHPSCYNHNNNNTWGGDDGTMRLKTFFHFLFSISFSYGLKISENVRFQFNFKLTISENFVTRSTTQGKFQNLSINSHETKKIASSMYLFIIFRTPHKSQ